MLYGREVEREREGWREREKEKRGAWDCRQQAKQSKAKQSKAKQQRLMVLSHTCFLWLACLTLWVICGCVWRVCVSCVRSALSFFGHFTTLYSVVCNEKQKDERTNQPPKSREPEHTQTQTQTQTHTHTHTHTHTKQKRTLQNETPYSTSCGKRRETILHTTS